MAEKSSSIHLVPPYIISPWSTLQSRIYSAGHDSDLYWLEAKAAAAVLQTGRGQGWPEAEPSQGWKTLLQLSQGGELRKRSLLAVQIIFLIYYIIDNFFLFFNISYNKPNLSLFIDASKQQTLMYKEKLTSQF